MASVKKFDESAVVNQLRHIERTIQNPENKDICKERTVENYSLAPQRGISSYDYYVERKKELYCYNRKDVKVMAGWIVTVPKNLKESDRERFFQVTYEFLIERYGERNCIQAIVHNDEGGQPHMHFLFIPATSDQKHGGEKICANDVLNKTELRNFHPALQKWLIDHDVQAKALQYVTSFAGTSERNTAGCKQACDTAIRLFATNPHIKKSVGRPQKGREAFVPEQLEEKNVYVKIQDAKLELYAPLLHIITAQCMDYFSYRANNHQNTILFCLDEFASFGRLDITAALRKLRKKHVRIMILTQSMADIDMIYGKDERMAMLNNFTYKVVLGCSDSDTQEYFSRLIGEQNAYRKGISKNGRQITNSKTEVRERIVPPAELARLGRKLILLTSGEYYILRKNFYFESSLWDRIIKYMKNLSREDEEDFPTENTLALDKKKEKI